MGPSDHPRAVAAATAVASRLGLEVDDAIVLHASNRLAIRLLPCDVLARVAPAGHRTADFEVMLAQRLAATDCPVGGLDRRVAPRVHDEDGFAVTLWTHLAPSPDGLATGAYADALVRLHRGLRHVDVDAPHHTDRVAEAQEIVEDPDRSPALADADRDLLLRTLRDQVQAIDDRGGVDQLLHGEPHPGNLLGTAEGPMFIDIETCCRGPVELDLAYVPVAVSEEYPGADPALLGECRGLVLATVAAWRWDRDDRLPNGRQAGEDLLDVLRAGPPWPALVSLMPPA
jgi:hypothetical protein